MSIQGCPATMPILSGRECLECRFAYGSSSPDSTLWIVSVLLVIRLVVPGVQMQFPLATSIKRYWLWYLLVTAGLALFVLAPGGFAEKSRTILHGLCAQTPSHSFSFGGVLLPFDARMTGIYSGSLVTLIYLGVRGRLFAWGNPPWRVIFVLAVFVLAMAADGFNSLLTDLGVWHPWTPRNELRLVTGYATGITLATVLSWLMGSSLYRLGTATPGVQGGRDLVLLWTPFLPLTALILSGATWLYVPLSMMLMVSAWLTMSILGLVIVVLTFRLDDRVGHFQAIHVPGAVAGLVGLGIMLTLAFGRICLESTIGIPSTL